VVGGELHLLRLPALQHGDEELIVSWGLDVGHDAHKLFVWPLQGHKEQSATLYASPCIKVIAL